MNRTYKLAQNLVDDMHIAFGPNNTLTLEDQKWYFETLRAFPGSKHRHAAIDIVLGQLEALSI
jgi:hypothetical protein